MKQWHYVNQQVYDQFTFYVWANDWLGAERIYKTNKLPVKCNFCGFVLTDTEKKNVLQDTRKTEHYGNIESITFNDFIKKVMVYE